MEDGASEPERLPSEQDETAKIVLNMALAHELAMNENFELSQQPEDSLEGQVRKVVHQAFWDTLQSDLSQDPPNYRHALILFTEIKQILLLLLHQRHVTLRNQINEVLDMDLIQQQVEHNALDIHRYVNFVQSIMSKLCAPVRDEEVKKISETPPDNIVEIFKQIFHALDLMQLDMANFQLKTVRPAVVQQSIEYERKKFKEFVEANPNGLVSTKEWLRRAKLEDLQSKEQESEAGVDHSKGATADSEDKSVEFSEVLSRGYVGILLGSDNWPYPETLIIDEHRLGEMRWTLHRTVLIGSVILVTLNSVGKPLSGDSQYIEKLKEVLYIILDGVPEYGLAQSMPNVYEQVASETDKTLEARGFAKIGDEQRELFKAHIVDIATPNHAVHTLLTRRAKDYLIQIIAHTGGSSTGQPPPVALKHVQTELGEIGARFAQIISHNRAVFLPFYKEIFDSLQ